VTSRASASTRDIRASREAVELRLMSESSNLKG
jgi:hypothetical protein